MHDRITSTIFFHLLSNIIFLAEFLLNEIRNYCAFEGKNILFHSFFRILFLSILELPILYACFNAKNEIEIVPNSIMCV